MSTTRNLSPVKNGKRLAAENILKETKTEVASTRARDNVKSDIEKKSAYDVQFEELLRKVML